MYTPFITSCSVLDTWIATTHLPLYTCLPLRTLPISRTYRYLRFISPVILRLPTAHHLGPVLPAFALLHLTYRYLHTYLATKPPPACLDRTTVLSAFPAIRCGSAACVDFLPATYAVGGITPPPFLPLLLPCRPPCRYLIAEQGRFLHLAAACQVPGCWTFWSFGSFTACHGPRLLCLFWTQFLCTAVEHSTYACTCLSVYRQPPAAADVGITWRHSTFACRLRSRNGPGLIPPYPSLLHNLTSLLTCLRHWIVSAAFYLYTMFRGDAGRPLPPALC